MSGVLTVPGNQPPAPVTVPEPSSLLGYIAFTFETWKPISEKNAII